jgi:hypothetical protein
MNFGQVLTAMITPFDHNGEVDFNATKTLVNYLIANGSDGLVVAGTTGESPTLTTEEKVDLFKFVVKVVDGRVPVIAGTGSNNTKASISLTRQAEAAGVVDRPEAVQIGAPERVNRLVLVADREHPRLGAAQRPDQLELDRVRVLELVDQQVVEALPVALGDCLTLAEQSQREQLEIVEVDARALRLRGGEALVEALEQGPDRGVGILQVRLAVAEALDLAAHQLNTAFQRVEHLETMARLAVFGDHANPRFSFAFPAFLLAFAFRHPRSSREAALINGPLFPLGWLGKRRARGKRGVLIVLLTGNHLAPMLRPPQMLEASPTDSW